ncbi:hypothetical protein HGRIS_000385 [Hohenbuehelia grisea]|uniref:Uncharacterized protein n=1 Tax=Hohenbuehelia grisea TaxID=104357 RepID=A0ABR3JR16_9AGAR
MSSNHRRSPCKPSSPIRQKNQVHSSMPRAERHAPVAQPQPTRRSRRLQGKSDGASQPSSPAPTIIDEANVEDLQLTPPSTMTPSDFTTPQTPGATPGPRDSFIQRPTVTRAPRPLKRHDARISAQDFSARTRYNGSLAENQSLNHPFKVAQPALLVVALTQSPLPSLTGTAGNDLGPVERSSFTPRHLQDVHDGWSARSTSGRCQFWITREDRFSGPKEHTSISTARKQVNCLLRHPWRTSTWKVLQCVLDQMARCSVKVAHSYWGMMGRRYIGKRKTCDSKLACRLLCPQMSVGGSGSVLLEQSSSSKRAANPDHSSVPYPPLGL